MLHKSVVRATFATVYHAQLLIYRAFGRNKTRGWSHVSGRQIEENCSIGKVFFPPPTFDQNRMAGAELEKRRGCAPKRQDRTFATYSLSTIGPRISSGVVREYACVTFPTELK